jgi:hypothetical protein
VAYNAAFLDPLIVPAPYDFAVYDQNGPDGYAAVSQAFLRLFDCRKQEVVHEE